MSRDQPRDGSADRVAEAQTQATFAPAPGWRRHIPPAECDGRETVVHASDGVVVHVMPGQMRPDADGSEAPALAVYIARGRGEDDPRPELRPVFYGAGGERHALQGGGGGGSDGVGFTGFDLKPDALALDNVAFMGVEARTGVDGDPE